jgi:hypothetical protein
MTYRKPKAAPSVPSTDEPVFECMLGFSARVNGRDRFIPTGATIRGDDDVLRSPWAPYFIRRPHTDAERVAADAALMAYRERRNPVRPEGPPKYPGTRGRPAYAIRGDRLRAWVGGSKN